MSRSPYKLLDYYTYEDRALFFGREEETRKMVGEILSTRLLVLFSPSGSGKTSLINAGVRPQLEKIGYQTVYTRLESKPIPSVRRAVSEVLELPPRSETEDLYEFIKNAAQAAKKPLVIFLDQFEEFFIVFKDKKDLRQAFIEQIARIKYDDELPVFLVLSLREDYFANLHEFRDAIPSIFQNNANIRLEPFNEKAARHVIEKPLSQMGWSMEEGLVDAIIKDLKTDKGIEPIKLQQICAALWDKRPDGESKQVPLSLYKKDLGGAEKILSSFLYDRLNRIPRNQHSLMVLIFESLKTPDNTKRYQPLEDLSALLKVKKTQQLDRLLRKLSNLDVLRQEERSGTQWYEFKHDSIVDKINQWIKARQEKRNRKRFLLFALLPTIILLISIFSYLFIQYHTFYATFTQPEYYEQKEEIVIIRGFNPFNERITTGLFKSDVKYLATKNALRQKLKISFWDKADWKLLFSHLNYYERWGNPPRMKLDDLGEDNIKETVFNYYEEGYNQASNFVFSMVKTNEHLIDTHIQLLKSKDKHVRRHAIHFLSRLKKVDKGTIDAFIHASKDEDYDVQEHALYSLGKLEKVDDEVLHVLIQSLKSGKSNIKIRAASSLGRLGIANKSVVDALIETQKHDYFKKVASESLCKLGISDTNAIIDIYNQILKDGDSFARQTVARHLGWFGYSNTNIINVLKTTLSDMSSEVILQGAESLVRLGYSDKTFIDTLFKILKTRDFTNHFRAGELLVQLAKVDKSIIEPLIKSLKTVASKQNFKMGEFLYQMGRIDTRTIYTLNEALKSIDFTLKFQATVILARLGYKNEIDIKLLNGFLEHPSTLYRKRAAFALGQQGEAHNNVIDALKKSLKDSIPLVRSQAALSLGILFRDKTNNQLIDLLKKDSSDDRTIAIHTLYQRAVISPQLLNTINDLTDRNRTPWVRLAVSKMFNLFQERFANEKNSKFYINRGDSYFKDGEFTLAELLYQHALKSLQDIEYGENIVPALSNTAALIKYKQAKCTARLTLIVPTIEHLEAALKYDPAQKERLKKEMAQENSEWKLIKDNWFVNEVLLDSGVRKEEPEKRDQTKKTP